MRRRVKAIVIAAVLIVALAVAGPLLYRHFVTDRIMDKDGMENPFISEAPDNSGAPEDDTGEPNE